MKRKQYSPPSSSPQQWKHVRLVSYFFDVLPGVLVLRPCFVGRQVRSWDESTLQEHIFEVSWSGEDPRSFIACVSEVRTRAAIWGFC